MTVPIQVPPLGLNVQDGGLIGAIMAMAGTVQGAAALVALAGGGQTGATQLVNGINNVVTCATNSDSVQLPAAMPGQLLVVLNPTGQTLAVFGKAGRTDTINGTAGATGVTQATLKHAIYACIVENAWGRILSA